jgi:hypothetical protein
MSLTADTTPKGLILTGLVLASALATANAVTNIFTTETVGAKLGKLGVAALFVAGTSLAAGTLLKHGTPVAAPAKAKYYK